MRLRVFFSRVRDGDIIGSPVCHSAFIAESRRGTNYELYQRTKNPLLAEFPKKRRFTRPHAAICNLRYRTTKTPVYPASFGDLQFAIRDMRFFYQHSPPQIRLYIEKLMTNYEIVKTRRYNICLKIFSQD